MLDRFFAFLVRRQAGPAWPLHREGAVEAHGGAIGVDREPGHGAPFWFTLPAAQVG